MYNVHTVGLWCGVIRLLLNRNSNETVKLFCWRAFGSIALTIVLLLGVGVRGAGLYEEASIT